MRRVQRQHRNFTVARPVQLQHEIGTRVRIVVPGEFFAALAEITSYTMSKSPVYRVRFFNHPWQQKQPDARWSFAEHEIELAEEP